MNLWKGLCRLALCTLFFIGFTCGYCQASEQEAPEKALHEIHGTQEEHQMLEMKGEAEEEAQEMAGEAQEEAQEMQEDVEHELHETKGE